MKSSSSPLIDRSTGRWLLLLLLESCGWIAAVVLALTCVSSFVIGFARWDKGGTQAAPVIGLFLAWHFERTRSNLGIFAFALVLIVGSIAKNDQSSFIRMSATLPVILLCSFGAKQACYYAQAFRNERRIAQGQPFTLYLRSSMADDGPFFGIESNLVKTLEPIGPTVMLATRRIIRKSGIVRIDWRVWQDRIGELMSHASLVVFFMMPRRGIDKPGEDLFWEEFEDPAVKALLPTGKILLFFREGWANKSLPCINKNGSVYIGDTSLMSEVHRILRKLVHVKWPEDFRRTRFVWFSPGAKPQGLGEFNSSLGLRRRFQAELSPILDHFGVQSKRIWKHNCLRPILFLAAAVSILWIGNLEPILNPEIIARFRTQIVMFSVIIWAAIVVTGVRKVRHYLDWIAYDYDNFVLHDKYRFRNWTP